MFTLSNIRDPDVFYKRFEQFIDPENKRNDFNLVSKLAEDTSFFGEKRDRPIICAHDGKIKLSNNFIMRYNDFSGIFDVDVLPIILVFRKNIFGAMNENRFNCSFNFSCDHSIKMISFDYIGYTGRTTYARDKVEIKFDYWKLIKTKVQEFLSSNFKINCVIKDIALFLENNQKNPIRIELCWNLWDMKALPTYPFPLPLKIAPIPISPLSEALLTDLKKGKREYTDVTIICKDDVLIPVHKIVLLVVGNPIFKAMVNFGESNKAIDLKDKKLSLDFSSHHNSVMEAFIKFIYDRQNPFANKNVGDIDAQDLLDLAVRYEMGENLVAFCTQHLAENVDEESWENIGDLGTAYKNKHLLEIYDCFRIRNGMPLPSDTAKVYKELGIYFPDFAPVLVPCNVKYGQAIGFFCAPHWDKELPAFLTWTEKGWLGATPLGVDFKYAILDYQTGKLLQWEQKSGSRRLDNATDEPLLMGDVKFK